MKWQRQKTSNSDKHVPVTGADLFLLKNWKKAQKQELGVHSCFWGHAVRASSLNVSAFRVLRPLVHPARTYARYCCCCCISQSHTALWVSMTDGSLTWTGTLLISRIHLLFSGILYWISYTYFKTTTLLNTVRQDSMTHLCLFFLLLSSSTCHSSSLSLFPLDNTRAFSFEKSVLYLDTPFSAGQTSI